MSLTAAVVVLLCLLPISTAHATSSLSRDTDDSGLVATIDRVHPVTLTKGKPLKIQGTIANTGSTDWRDLQVYLNISYYPATDKEGLESFAALPDDQGFGHRIYTYGLFAQIGDVPPGTEKSYHLSIPFDSLEISGAPGVYHVGVSALGTTREGRDSVSDARTDTLVPLLPQHPQKLDRATTTLVIPFSAPIRRVTSGAFLQDQLARSFAVSGRLRHVLDFALHAPPHTVQIVVDPALLAAAEDMSEGYVVADSAKKALQAAYDERSSAWETPTGSPDTTTASASASASTDTESTSTSPLDSPAPTTAPSSPTSTSAAAPSASATSTTSTSVASSAAAPSTEPSGSPASTTGETENEEDTPPPPGKKGTGQLAAQRWLRDFTKLANDQSVLLLPWGTPAVNTLAANDLNSVVSDAVAASKRYAQEHHRDWPVVGWQRDVPPTKEALQALHAAGVALQFMPRHSMPDLPTDDEGYPRTTAQIPVGNGSSVPVVAVQNELAGIHLREDTSPFQVRQGLLADAVVRSLGSTHSDPTTVATLPFNWDPGPRRDRTGQVSAFDVPMLLALPATSFTAGHGPTYTGPIDVPQRARHQLPPQLLSSITSLRATMQTFTDILADDGNESLYLQQELALLASTYWSQAPELGQRLAHAQQQALAERISQITVSGPPFVAMSSDSGRFPITVTNGLDRSVTVKLKIIPENPALHVKPLEPITLAPGQQRAVQVTSTAEGSGLTSVHARLTTKDGEVFGKSWEFEVRATHIGMVIWVVMGVGLAVVFAVAAYRIFRRIRNAYRRRTGTHPT